MPSRIFEKPIFEKMACHEVRTIFDQLHSSLAGKILGPQSPYVVKVKESTRGHRKDEDHNENRGTTQREYSCLSITEIERVDAYHVPKRHCNWRDLQDTESFQ